MCGIIAYVGKKDCCPLLLAGLRRLEYRGYDSAGIAAIQNEKLITRKKKGRVQELAELIKKQPINANVGISHTRWATHGKPSDANAHPHCDAKGELAIVHNGVIENFNALREKLIANGIDNFKSETDTEILACLIGYHYQNLKNGNGGDQDSDTKKNNILKALEKALSEVKGAYGLAMIHSDCPKQIFGARLGSPLVLGLAENERLLCSDATALVAHTRQAVFLEDHDVVCMSAEDFEISNMRGKKNTVAVSEMDFDSQETEKGDYEHFMLKEIYEQPEAIENALRGRLSEDEATAHLGGLNMSPNELREIDRLSVCACGTAYHSALVGEYLIESIARIPVEVEIASEFRYRNLPLSKNLIQFVVSQSGETIDSLAALREAKRKGIRSLGIVNNVASAIARESDGGVYMHAGPEIGVAATKSFTSQIAIFSLLALTFGRIHYMSVSDGLRFISHLKSLPAKIRQILSLDADIKKIAKKYLDVDGVLFFGRLGNYPVALEGALKLKEISYIHSSGHPSAELKHGVIALVNERTPSVFIAPRDSVYEKNLANIQEVKARNGPVIAIVSEGCNRAAELADDVVFVPETSELLSPLLTVIPLQLLSYHIANLLGKDVDKPRNLAKSVTVE